MLCTFQTVGVIRASASRTSRIANSSKMCVYATVISYPKCITNTFSTRGLRRVLNAGYTIKRRGSGTMHTMRVTFATILRLDLTSFTSSTCMAVTLPFGCNRGTINTNLAVVLQRTRAFTATTITRPYIAFSGVARVERLTYTSTVSISEGMSYAPNAILRIRSRTF